MERKVYILAYMNDTPYHQRMECWLRSSLSELKECYQDEFGDNYIIYVCEWNKETEYFSDSFENLESDSGNDIEFDELPDEITYCERCLIFYDHIQEFCTKCQKSCVSIDDY